MAIPNLYNNSPTTGSIAWDAFNIRYGVSSFAVAAGNTALKYVWWRLNNGTPVLQAGDNVPDGVLINTILNRLFDNPDPDNPAMPRYWSALGAGQTYYNAAHEEYIDSTQFFSSSYSLALKTNLAGLHGPGSLQDTIVTTGEVWRFKYVAKGSVAQAGGLYVMMMNAAGTTEIARSVGANPSAALGTTWTEYTGTITIPAGYNKTAAKVLVLSYNKALGEIAYVDNFEMGLEPVATLIQDDLVLFANKNGTAVNLQTAGLIEGGMIISGSVITDALAANAVTAEKILSGTIDARHIRVGAIDTNALAAGAITADKIAANSISADKFAATLVMAAKIVLGSNMVLSPEDGIVIQTTAGTIKLPTDGSPASFAGVVNAKTLEINNTDADGVGVNIRGAINYLAGILTASSGITSPGQAPVVSAYHPSLTYDGALYDYYIRPGGIPTPTCQHHSALSQLMMVVDDTATTFRFVQVAENGASKAADVVKPIGACGEYTYTSKVRLIDYDVAGVGTKEYMLALHRYDAAGTATTPVIYMKRYNTSLTEIGTEYRLDTLMPGLTNYGSWTFCHDATNVDNPIIRLFWFRGSDKKICSRTINVNGGSASTIAVNSVVHVSDPNIWYAKYLINNTFDVVTERVKWYRYSYATATPTVLTQAAVDHVANPAYTIDEYDIANLIDDFSDGFGKVRLIDNERIWDYDSLNDPVQTVQARFAWVDTDPLGTYASGARTLPSPVAQLTSLKPGAHIRIDTPLPPDGGSPDDPNDNKIYVRTGTTENWQLDDNTRTILNQGGLSKYISRPGAAPANSQLPTVNDFAGRPGAVGRFKSAIAGWDFFGDGTYSLDPNKNLLKVPWINIPLATGWTTYDAAATGYSQPQYRKIGDIVYLRGMVQAGAVNTAIGTLPLGYRPTEQEIFSCVGQTKNTGAVNSGTVAAHTHTLGSNVHARVDVRTDGVIIPSGQTSVGWLTLSGIHFAVEL